MDSKVQYLRGLSILAVLLFHFDTSLFPNGFLGVDIFFLISGYLLIPKIHHLINHSGLKGIMQFWKSRFRRLFPALGFTFGISIILVFFFGSIDDIHRSGVQVILSQFALGNFGAYKYSFASYFAPNPNPFVHSWSLAVEEQLYLVVPLILVLARKRRHLQLVLLVFLISSLILHISLLLFGARYLYTEILEGVIFYSPLTRAWEFILGGLVSWSKANHKKLNFSIPAKLSLLFFVFYILFFKNVNSNISLLISTLGLLLAVSLIICDDSLLDYSIIGKSLIFLGNRSYSVYLWHMPIGYLLTYNFDGRISEIALFAMYMAITLLLSQITFSLVEFRFIARGIEKRETV